MPGLPAFPPVVGVDVGGTKMLAVRLDPDGEVVADPVRKASPRDGPGLVEEVAASVQRLAAGSATGAIGIGRAGPGGRRLARCASPPTCTVWPGPGVTRRWRRSPWLVRLGRQRRHRRVLGRARPRGSPGHGRGSDGHPRDRDRRAPSSRAGCSSRGPTGMRASSATWSSIRTAPAVPAASRAAGSGSRRAAASVALGREMAIAGEAPRLVDLAGGDAEAVRGEHVTAAAAEADVPAWRS